MGLIFHNGHNQAFYNYTQGRPWDDPHFVGNAGNFAQFNTQQHIRTILLKQGSRSTFTYIGRVARQQNRRVVYVNENITINFKEIIQQVGEPNAYVVKGIHQLGQGFIVTPHISVGFGGHIYHLDLLDDAKQGLVVFGVTRGDQYTDPEGFGFQ